MTTVDTSSVEHLKWAAEAARKRGDEAEYWRLRLAYLNAQAELYARERQEQGRR